MKDNIVASLELEKGFANKFQSYLVAEVKKRLKASISSITESIEVALQTMVKTKLSEAPEVQSLAGGKLRYQLGLVDGAARISSIINIWADSIEVTYVAKMGSLGGITINMRRNNYSDVISVPEAVFVTEKGVKLEWLRWLLLEGDKRIVSNYFFKKSSRGRAGGGIMAERQNASWGVPSQFAGTENNNFATRALETINDEIDVLVRREIVKVL